MVVFNNDDNLIFTRNDYADPGKSPLFDVLKNSSDQTVAKLAERLEECCALPVEQVPDLEEVLRGVSAQSPPRLATSAQPASSAQPAAPSAPASAPPPATAQPASGGSYRQALQTGQPAGAPPAPTSSAPRPSATSAQPAQPGAPAQAARPALAVPRPLRPGELKKVAQGVAVTVVVVIIALAALLAWAGSVRGWGANGDNTIGPNDTPAMAAGSIGSMGTVAIIDGEAAPTVTLGLSPSVDQRERPGRPA